MWLAFYRGPGNLITQIIRWRTKGPYSHVELVFSNGLSFSSTGRKPAGVYLKQKDLSKDWDFVKLPVSDQSLEAAAMEFARQFVGQAFDWVGICSYLFRFLMNRAGDRWYCSDLVILLVQRQFGLFCDLPPNTSPNGLFRVIKRRCGDTTCEAPLFCSSLANLADRTQAAEAQLEFAFNDCQDPPADCHPLEQHSDDRKLSDTRT